MDNITHSLVGVAIAEIVQPAGEPPARRRLWLGAGVVAANLPDVDLVYTWITSAPLGYLLHHRGHTHTLAGLIVLGVACWALLRGPAGALTAAGKRALAAVVGINLAGHLALDGLNSYGVHPLYPLNARWYYGDAVFIFEPWLWIVLGTAAAWNARRPALRYLTAGGIGILLVALIAVRLVPAGAMAVMAGLAAAIFVQLRTVGARTRASVALAVAMCFVAGMLGLSRIVAAQAATAAGSTSTIDIVTTPDPGMPVCWSVMVLSLDPTGNELRTLRGTLSLAPSWYAAQRCASDRLSRTAESTLSGDRHVAWRDDTRQPLAALRALARDECRVRAWLQFGRAPALRDGTLMDLRFDTPRQRNFSAMRLENDGACPTRLPHWTPPRADLFGADARGQSTEPEARPAGRQP